MPLVAWSPVTQASRAHARAALVEVKVQALERTGRRDLAKTTLVDAFYPSYSIVRELVLSRRREPPGTPGREVPGELVELIGVEPTTSSLQSWRSTN